MLLKGSEAGQIILDKIWEDQKDNILLEDGAKSEMIEFR